jgi:hypothetical protein
MHRDVIDNTVIKCPIALSSTTKGRRRKQCQYLCLDRPYSSKSVKQKIIKRGFVRHMPYKIKRG